MGRPHQGLHPKVPDGGQAPPGVGSLPCGVRGVLVGVVGGGGAGGGGTAGGPGPQGPQFPLHDGVKAPWEGGGSVVVRGVVVVLAAYRRGGPPFFLTWRRGEEGERGGCRERGEKSGVGEKCAGEGERTMGREREI